MIYFKRMIKWGRITVALDKDVCIAGLWFDKQKYYPDIPEDACFIEELSKEERIEFFGSMNVFQESMDAIKNFDIQMKEYEEGIRKDFDLPLAPKGSEFRQIVWKELQKINQGDTVTYGELGTRVADRMGRESMSAQAIGGAVGHNPISIIIPCHRVIGSNGRLTGYAGGIDKKAALLAHEGRKEYS